MLVEYNNGGTVSRQAGNDDDRVRMCIYISPENTDDDRQSHAILARPGPRPDYFLRPLPKSYNDSFFLDYYARTYFI